MSLFFLRHIKQHKKRTSHGSGVRFFVGLIFGEKWHKIDTENTYAFGILWVQGGK
jgi:hypothetical protein